MKITAIKAVPISYRVPEGRGVTLGIGRTVKRDAVLVKVTTDEGLVGWGEAHHGRAPGAVAKLVDTTISELAVGFDPMNVVGVWDKVYRMQLASHGVGAAAAMALSGLDMALWDIRGKASGWPVYQLLGGTRRGTLAYAGGISLGFQDPASLVDEAQGYVARHYRALKLRVGDTPLRDIARVQAVRKAVGDAVEILVDANTQYSLDDVRRVMPAFTEAGVGWLEEPFSPHDHHSYKAAAAMSGVPLAAGENSFTRYEFARILEDGALRYVQPDLSKAGGLTECARIATLASARKLSFNPHTSATTINMGATLHLLAAVDNPGYYEGDVAPDNPFRDAVASAMLEPDENGLVWPPEGPGFGIEVDEAYLDANPLIDGPCYV